MTPPCSRRAFLETVAALSAAAAAAPRAVAARTAPQRPVAIASSNGWHPVAKDGAAHASAVETALAALRDPAVTRDRYPILEAAVRGVAVVEDDEADHSVGKGGLPNEEGVVQLDASVMHGPTHRAGAVGALEQIKNPARVAKLVLSSTDHSFLVGEGAFRFARAHGIAAEDLLTEDARRMWLYWRQRHSDMDDWLAPPDEEVEQGLKEWFEHGTIHLSIVDAKGDLAAATTTSGLSFKIPGRVGDSPIVGAGMYCDNDIGSAGATGRGEEAIVSCAAFSVVSEMGNGREPQEACLEVLKRVAANARKRGLFTAGKPQFQLKLYALRKDGAYGGGAMLSGATFAVADGVDGKGRHEVCGSLYDA